jgi:hypothetical protein
MTNRVRAVAALCLTLLPQIFGQAPSQFSSALDESCDSLSYQSQNQIDYGPLTVRHIVGVVRDGDGVAVTGTWVAVFTEPGHGLMVGMVSDKNGLFVLGKLRPGTYRLVAKYDHFGVANVLLRVAFWPSGGVFRNRTLLVHLIPRSIDTTSYVGYAQ